MPLAQAGNKAFLLAALIVLAASFLFPGCASSSKYVGCCQRAYVFNTTATPNTLLQTVICNQTDGSVYSTTCLGGAQGLTAANFSGGTVWCTPTQCNGRPVMECTKMPGCIWRGSSADGTCEAIQCSDMADQKDCEAALCRWRGGEGGYCDEGPYSPARVAMPLCVDEAPARCVNNKCSAMLCGYRSIKVAPPPSSQDWNNDTQNMPRMDKPPAINLKETSCQFKTMNQQTYNAVKNARGELWVNAFRFGVGSSFEDFEASRYFFPASDRFCAASPAPNTKDRFVVYVNAKNTWCAIQDLYYYKCSENQLNFTDNDTCTMYCKDASHCERQPFGAKYMCLESKFLYNDEAGCKKECGIITDPHKCSLSSADYPFLESNGSFKMAGEPGTRYLDVAAYKNILMSQYRPIGTTVNELADFECEESNECASLYCNYDPYIRGRCMNSTNGERIDCGCYRDSSSGAEALNCKDAGAKPNAACSGNGETACGTTPNCRWNGVLCESSLQYPLYQQVVRKNIYGYSTCYRGEGHYFQDKYCLMEIEGAPQDRLFASNDPAPNLGSRENPTYRIFVQADTATESMDHKLFKSCEIPDTKGAVNNPTQKLMCIYTLDKSSPTGGCGSSSYNHDYMTVMLPKSTYGDCKSKEHETSWFGCAFWTRSYMTYLNTWNENGYNFWEYEISLDENTKTIGICNVSSPTRAPFIDAKKVGWCEGCTYSTLASQRIAPTGWTDENGDPSPVVSQVWSQAPRYLQANVMPVFDVHDTKTGAFLDGYYDDCDGECPSRFIETERGTWYYPREWICKAGGNGAALYVVADTSMIDDTALDYGSFYAGSQDPVLAAYNGLAPGYLVDGTDITLDVFSADAEEYIGYSMNGRAAAIWRALTLKTACANPPLVGLAINGFGSQADTNNQAKLNGLIGNKTNPGTLFSFFYTSREGNEFAMQNRIARGTPDSYPGKIDVLMQEWYPTCALGGPEDNKTKLEVEARANFSRVLLSNFSRPSLIWKFHFPTGSQCNQNEFLNYLFRHKGDLVDAGIIGVIYDSWQSGESPLDLGTSKSQLFCEVQNYSRQVLGLSKHTYGQKVYAANKTCVCEVCNDGSYGLGICDSRLKTPSNRVSPEATDQLYCNDGQMCQPPAGVNWNTDYWNYYCPQTCVNYSACDPCSQSTESAFCRIESPDNLWKTIKPYSSLTDAYWDIISALPAKDKCCLEKQSDDATLRYTFLKRTSSTQRSEFLQFPRRGETGIDCGRTPDTSFLKYCDIEIPVAEKDIACWKVVGS